MTYYVGAMPVGDHLEHHGIKGMRWGQRRFQNDDGSLTALGRARYGTKSAYNARQRMIRSAGNLGSVTQKNIRKGSAGRSAIKRAGAQYDKDLAAYKKAYKSAKSARKQGRSDWYQKNKKTIKRAAIGAGVTAGFIAGYKYRKQIGAAAKQLKFDAGRYGRAAGYKLNAARAKLAVSPTGKSVRKAASQIKFDTARYGRAVGNKAKTAYAKSVVSAKGAARKVGSSAVGKAASQAKFDAARYGKAVGNKAKTAYAKAITSPARTRVGMMRGMTGTKLKSARRGISNAAGKVKRSSVVNTARMAGYEALGRADNAAAFIRRNGAKGVAKKVVRTAARNPVKTVVAVGAAKKGYKYIKRRKARKAASK